MGPGSGRGEFPEGVAGPRNPGELGGGLGAILVPGGPPGRKTRWGGGEPRVKPRGPGGRGKNPGGPKNRPRGPGLAGPKRGPVAPGGLGEAMARGAPGGGQR